MIEPFVISASVVGLAELGDRTQLLSFLLVCRYRRPLSILSGILLATIISNVAAAFAGRLAGDLLTSSILKWVMGCSLVIMAAWMLVPEKPGDKNVAAAHQRSAFLAALCGFLISEIGDKTQLATVALAAHYKQVLPVIIGSTIGMMIVNTPVVFGGHYIEEGSKFLRAARYIAAVIFLLEAVLTFSGYKLF